LTSFDHHSKKKEELSGNRHKRTCNILLFRSNAKLEEDYL